MNQPEAPPEPSPVLPLSPPKRVNYSSEHVRTLIFLGIQLFFLVLSPWAGGFHNKLWSMLDSALLVGAIGITGLVFVLEGPKARRFAFRVGLALYVLAIIDMSINILLTGWLGWKKVGLGIS